MRRLVIGDKRVRVREEGELASDGKRSPVFLIHGAGASSAMWMDVVKRLAPARHVIAPDLPGHGQSDPWHEAPAAALIDLYRDAVGTICAHLGVAKAVLVGHSMGGAIALRCALAWPERVAAIVLLCSAARMKVAPATLAAFADEQVDPADVLAEIAYSPTTPRDVIDRWRPLVVQAPREVLLADLRACAGFDVRPSLAAIKVPVLAIGGSDDLMLPPKLTLQLAKGIANARAVIIPHAGHMAFHEQPDAFHTELDRFLSEVQ